MPEINTSQTNPQKPEPVFAIPERRSYKKYFFALIIIILLAAVGGVAYWYISQNAVVEPAPQPQTQEQEPLIKAGTTFYLATDSEGDSSVERDTRLYQFSNDSTVADQEILKTSEKFFNILTKFDDHQYIADSANNKLFLLDIAKGKIDTLFELADNPLIREVAVSSDKKWLAYARNVEGLEAGKSGGSIWLYNFETKQQKELVKQTVLGLYQGFSVLGWRNNDSELIVSGIGGDAGATWGDIYQVNAVTGEMVKVSPVAEKNKMEFLRGRLSPDGDKWLYTHCEQPDAKSEQDGFWAACASGTELRTYDFGNKQIKTVYQNLRYDNNVDKNMLRIFLDFMWQDENNVMAIVPGAILNIQINSAKAEEVYAFDRTNPQNFKNHSMQLRSVNEDQLVFTEEDKWQVFNFKTNKIVEVNRSGKKETIINWLN